MPRDILPNSLSCKPPTKELGSILRTAVSAKYGGYRHLTIRRCRHDDSTESTASSLAADLDLTCGELARSRSGSVERGARRLHAYPKRMPEA